MPVIGETTMQTADAGDNTAVNAAYNHLNNLLPIVNRLYFDADAHPADGSAEDVPNVVEIRTVQPTCRLSRI
jgi:hypothetical protein